MTGLLRRWGWLVLIVPMVVGLGRLRFDVEVLNLLPAEVPVVRGLQLYQKHFTSSRELILTVRGRTPEAAEAAVRQVAIQLRADTNLVAEVVWQPPWIEHPEQMIEFIGYLWLNQPPEVFAQLTHRLAPGNLEAVLREAREGLATSMSPTEIARLGFDPFGFTQLPGAGAENNALFSGPQEGFASADGHFRVVYVEAGRALPGYRACAAWLEEIETRVAAARESPEWPADVAIRYTGSPVFVAEIATGMAGDMQVTVLTTLALIIGLFWWAHRSWRPLFWLVVMLMLVVTGALAAGGLIFGTLNAVSLGFAAILLGLGVDYGLVVYQEARAEPHRSARELRQVLGPGLGWCAVTTSSAFLLLNLAGLPGLSQLGTLVGFGVLLAAVTMMYLYLPIVLRGLKTQESPASPPRTAPRSQRPYRIATVFILALSLLVLWRSGPEIDRTNRPLELANSEAQGALDELRGELSRQTEPLLVVIAGRDEAEVADRLGRMEAHLAGVGRDASRFRFVLPTAVWPHPERRAANGPAARALAAQAATMRTAAERLGFTPEALALTDQLLRAWSEETGSLHRWWPDNPSGRWLLKRASAWTGSGWLAAGAVYPGTNAPSLVRLAEQVDPRLPEVWVTSWPLLGGSLFEYVGHRVWWVVAAIMIVIGLGMRAAFHRWREVLLGFAALGFMLLIVQAVMGLAGWSWNLMNLTALPLLLGASVDYVIHVQVALRRP
ncbi:MAG: MMPL family transporter, partial [Limisphaerales bacterium]